MIYYNINHLHRGFQIFFWGHTSGPSLLRDGHLPRPHTSRRFVARPQSIQYLVHPFPTLLEKSGKSHGISFGLESGHPEYCKKNINCGPQLYNI